MSKVKKPEPEGFQIKRAHLYVALSLGIIALLGSFGIGFNLTTPGSTAVAALRIEMRETDLSITKDHDKDINTILDRMQTMETNILNNNREQVRLIVQALNRGK